MKKIVLTGGGTAGHVTPNIALMPELKKRGYDISYIGSYEGMEKGMIMETKTPYYGIATCSLFKRRICCRSCCPRCTCPEDSCDHSRI